jgi:branched-chain amino acid transport system permease protein
MPRLTVKIVFYGAILALAAAVPLAGEVFYTRLATQTAILGMVALSVDLLIGYGGMLTFGQAAFFGIGAYVTGILTLNGVTSAFIAWPIAIVAAAAVALVVGALALRTSGFQFIMVTLAFAQMIYYFWLSLRQFGGENGFSLPARNTIGPIGIENHTTFYYVVLALLVASVFLSLRLVNSQFGMVIQGIRDNERRVSALGFPPFRYKLVLFCLAGAISGLAGALMANHTSHVSTELLSWQQSGNFLGMVILGSSGTIVGPIFGAAIFVLFQQVVSDWSQHWLFFFGLLIVVRILVFKSSVLKFLSRRASPITTAKLPDSGVALPARTSNRVRGRD